ncbi:MAG: hypothetical protein JEZ11_04660 [Desulfobacterales bacterium]|nr:hypothetical protein [Desulfobacterales bacterium]
MDLTISRTTPVSRVSSRNEGTIIPVRKSGLREERQKKKRERQDHPGNGVVVRLSSQRDRDASAKKDAAGA